MAQNTNPRSQDPFPVGNQFLIVHHSHKPDIEDRTPLILGPGKAFGSGQHETTISCIKEMEKLGTLTGKRILDVGTGTGILAVAAALVGAARVVAFDIEMDAVLTCRNNVSLNRVEDRVLITCGSLDSIAPGREYHLILANIYGDIILKEAVNLAARLKPEGHLILSGIDYTDSTQISILFRNEGLEELSITFLQEYVTQVWVNPHRPLSGPREDT
ncbi:methyltransferase domain-containing protein [bacterium]|nr:MAG: methyltransferase domain-containing protein [bacterium]